MIEIIKGGNLLDAPEMVIAHQTNCQGVMGSGVALAIRNKYPQHYKDFMNDKRKPEQKLGTTVITYTDKKFIYGLYGQLHYSNRSLCNTSYPALDLALREMVSHSNSHGEVNHFALPYMIGCALGGGDWRIVNDILTNVSNEYRVTFYLYDLLNQSEEN